MWTLKNKFIKGTIIEGSPIVDLLSDKKEYIQKTDIERLHKEIIKLVTDFDPWEPDECRQKLMGLENQINKLFGKEKIKKIYKWIEWRKK